MIRELRRQQLRHVLLYCFAGPAAGACFGFAWEGYFLSLWQRLLLVLLVLPIGTIAVSACREALNIVRQVVALNSMARANAGGPAAASLHTPGTAGNAAPNGWDIFGGRRHGG